jgi:hypothetical protein
MAPFAALLASACVSAQVSYAPPPDVGAPSIPWIRSGPVTGYLFYYSPDGPWKEQRNRVLIATRGRGPGYRTKILWHVRDGFRRVTLTGRRLDGAGRFRQTYPGIRGSYFPSFLIVPRPGCWKVTVASAGHRGSFAFVAFDP